MQSDWSKNIKLSKKSENYFLDYVTSPLFQDGVKDLRKKYLIPHRGFKGFDTKEFSKKWLLYVPPAWVYVADLPKRKQLKLEYDRLLKAFQLNMGLFWSSLFKILLFHDIEPRKLLRISKEIVFIPGLSDLCEAHNLAEDYYEYTEEGVPPQIYLNVMKGIIDTHPVAICISPFASQNDIRNFISENWELIKIQQGYAGALNLRENNFNIDEGTSLRKTKTRIMRSRDSFVYESHLKGLSRKEIADQVLKKFHGQKLEENYISTIVNRVKKRQQGL